MRRKKWVTIFVKKNIVIEEHIWEDEAVELCQDIRLGRGYHKTDADGNQFWYPPHRIDLVELSDLRRVRQ